MSSPASNDPRQRLAALTDAVMEHLQFHRSEGILQLETEENPAPVSTVKPPPPAPTSTPAPQPAAAPPTESTTHESLVECIRHCSLCPLCEGRTHAVPGQGHDHPEIVFVGEGPGADEDRQGLPFVGAAGGVLNRLINRMGLEREDVWIGNIVKCRPPGNRKPMVDEMQACLPYLQKQLDLLKPKVIVCLGATAVEGLLGRRVGITRLRGTWQQFGDIDVMPTYHPAYLLRSEGEEKHKRYWEVWEDMVDVLGRIGREPPAKTDS